MGVVACCIASYFGIKNMSSIFSAKKGKSVPSRSKARLKRFYEQLFACCAMIRRIVAM